MKRKKITAIMAVIMMVAGLSACSGRKTRTKSPAAGREPALLFLGYWDYPE